MADKKDGTKKRDDFLLDTPDDSEGADAPAKTGAGRAFPRQRRYMAPVAQKRYALVHEGRVIDVKHGDMLMHPFGDAAEGKRVLDVSGARCAIGFVADSKGNVAPPLPNGDTLMGHEPAYHDRSTAPARVSAVYTRAFQTGEPHPSELSDEASSPQADDRASHPTAGLVQEGPVKAEWEGNGGADKGEKANKGDKVTQA